MEKDNLFCHCGNKRYKWQETCSDCSDKEIKKSLREQEEYLYNLRGIVDDYSYKGDVDDFPCYNGQHD